MSVDIIQLVCGGVELVHKMQSLWFYRFLQWFISGGQQVYVLVANTVKVC